MLSEMSDSHARALPRSLQQRRAEILKRRAEDDDVEARVAALAVRRRAREQAREAARAPPPTVDDAEGERIREGQEARQEFERRAQLGPALHVLQSHGITGTSAEMRQAYRRFARENHPDRQAGKTQAEKDQKEELFKRVNAAYSIVIGKGGRRTRKRRVHKRKHTRRRR